MFFVACHHLERELLKHGYICLTVNILIFRVQWNDRYSIWLLLFSQLLHLDQLLVVFLVLHLPPCIQRFRGMTPHTLMINLHTTIYCTPMSFSGIEHWLLLDWSISMIAEVRTKTIFMQLWSQDHDLRWLCHDWACKTGCAVTHSNVNGMDWQHC